MTLLVESFYLTSCQTAFYAFFSFFCQNKFYYNFFLFLVNFLPISFVFHFVEIFFSTSTPIIFSEKEIINYSLLSIYLAFHLFHFICYNRMRSAHAFRMKRKITIRNYKCFKQIIRFFHISNKFLI